MSDKTKADLVKENYLLKLENNKLRLENKNLKSSFFTGKLKRVFSKMFNGTN